VHSPGLIIRLGEPVSMLKHKAAIQRDVGRLEKWANRNLRKFSRDNCKLLNQGRSNTGWGLTVGSSCAGGEHRDVINSNQM